MEPILEVKNICKKYPTFELKNVSFEVQPGHIVGFIGRNGAGKSTTLKGIMNLVSLESGNVNVFGNPMKTTELEAKQRIGFSLSEVSYYPNKTIKQIVNVTKRFYKNFSEDKYRKLVNLFKLDENKKIQELSSGMKVKYNLAMALSCGADLLILDEPTSGLDPISRDEIIEIFLNIVKSGDKAILFSTHITSDLDKCANDIVYINNGEIRFDGTKEQLIGKYLLVNGDIKQLNNDIKKLMISCRDHEGNFEGLIEVGLKEKFSQFNLKVPDLEQIMIYLERGSKNEEFIF